MTLRSRLRIYFVFNIAMIGFNSFYLTRRILTSEVDASFWSHLFVTITVIAFIVSTLVLFPKSIPK